MHSVLSVVFAFALHLGNHVDAHLLLFPHVEVMFLRFFDFLVQALDLELRGLRQRLEILYLCHHLFELF